MIEYNYLTSFEIESGKEVQDWIQFVLDEEDRDLGEINYIFCDDEYLLEINSKELKHNTLTDIISLDYTVGRLVSGDIYISIERVRENALERAIGFLDELHRVMVHGILHFVGFTDSTDSEKLEMRSKEDYYLSLRTF